MTSWRCSRCGASNDATGVTFHVTAMPSFSRPGEAAFETFVADRCEIAFLSYGRWLIVNVLWQERPAEG